MIKHNTKSSKELIEALADQEDVIGFIPQKELFNRSTMDKLSLSEMKADKSVYLQNKKFFDDLSATFDEITDKV